MVAPDRDVLACYMDGVGAVDRISAEVVDWLRPTPCGQWTAADVAGHLLSVVRYYHRLLDAAMAGAPLGDLPTRERLADMNASDLAQIELPDGAERVKQFVTGADGYRQRLEVADWDVVLGTWTGLGTLTIGEHTGIVLGEWHVHAWDVARSAGSDHNPQDPRTVAHGQAASLRTIGPGDPWTEVLRAYGRDPDWSRTSGG